MLTTHEERFIDYWKNNRDREKKLFRQLLFGLPLGLLLGVGIFTSLVTGKWYERADMVANTELNPNVLIVAILAIAVFTGVFYKKFKWDQNEQLYKELLAKKRKEEQQNSSSK
jgi:hypothetical protein